VGNRLRGDDGAGLYLANLLKGDREFRVIEAGEAPENYLEKIIKERPEKIIFVDALDLGGKPGEAKFFRFKKDLPDRGSFSTHRPSLILSLNYLKKRTKAAIFILGIQPKECSLGKKISPLIKKRVEILAEKIKEGDWNL